MPGALSELHARRFRHRLVPFLDLRAAEPGRGDLTEISCRYASLNPAPILEDMTGAHFGGSLGNPKAIGPYAAPEG